VNINELNQYFTSDDLDDEAMEFIEMHGFLTSLSIVSGDLTDTAILEDIFSSKNYPIDANTAITALKSDISQALLNGDFPQLPDTIKLDENEEFDLLSLWSAGFMQGVFLNDTIWFAEYADEVAELTLPILSSSGLLDEEESELLDITENEDILDAMVEKIPDCVVDLYLIFNAPANA